MRTLEQRTRLYRNLVIAVSITGVLSTTMAFLLWNPWLALGLGLSVPMVGVYAYIDAALVARWRRTIRSMKYQSRLDVTHLKATISQLKHLPARTVRAMLEELDRP